MVDYIEKRKFRRFEVPDGKAKYKRIILSSIIKHFSDSCPVLNMGVGGTAFLSSEEFRNGEEIIIKLTAPNEKSVNLRSKVRWLGPITLSSDVIVGLEFMEFGSSKDLNPPEALNLLRRLYARYRRD